MSSAAIRAGRAFIEILSVDKTEAGFQEVTERLDNFATVVTTIGASLTAAATAALGSMLAATQVFASTADAIGKASERTGIAVKTLSELKFAAEASDVTFGQLQMGVRRLERLIAAAAEGNKQAAASFDHLGLSVQTLAGLSPDQQFRAVADAVARIDDPAQRAAAAFRIFGIAGFQLLPMLRAGAEGIERLEARARALGLIVRPEDAEAAGKFGDAIGDLLKQMQQMVYLVGASLAPMLTELLSAMQPIAARVLELIDGNRQLVAGLAIVIGVIGALGGALIGVGAAMIFTSFVLSSIPTIVATVTASFVMLKAALLFLVSPIGLIILAVVSLIALLPLLAYALDQALAGGAGLAILTEGFRQLWSVVAQASQGIFNALAKGNWQLAAGIAWAGVRVVFAKAIAGLKMLMVDFAAWLSKQLIDIFSAERFKIVVDSLLNVISQINAALTALELSPITQKLGIDVPKIGGVDQLKKASELLAKGDEATKNAMDKAAQTLKDQIGAEVSAAQAALDALTGVAAAERQKARERAAQIDAGGGGGGAGGFDDFRQRVAQGALSASQVGRFAFSVPQMDQQLEEQRKQTGLLEQIADNTEGLDAAGAEFAE